MTTEQAVKHGELLLKEFKKSLGERSWQYQCCLAAFNALKNPLLAFIEEEVPFRISHFLSIEDANQIPQEAVDACIDRLYDNSDKIFDYDMIDSMLIDELGQQGIG